MNQLTRFLDEIDHRRGFTPAPTPAPSYRAADRLITDAAVEMREHLAAGETTKAEALAVAIEETQRAAETVERTNPNYLPPEPPAGSETWRLTLACWAEVLVHGPRAERTFFVAPGATPEQALATACGMYRRPFGGLHIEKPIRFEEGV